MVRIKHRYLLVNILYPDPKKFNLRLALKDENSIPYSVQFRQPCPDQLDVRTMLRVIKDGVSELFGDYGVGKVIGSLQIKYLSTATSTAIIRVSRDHYRLVWAALTFTTKLPVPINQPCVFQTVRVSGTIRKAEEEAIRRARISIRRAQRVTKGPAPAIAGGAAAEASARLPLDEDDDLDMLNGIEDKDEPGDVDEESDEAG